MVKAFGREDQERQRVADVTERAFRFSMTRTRLLAGYDIYLKMMPLLVQAGLLAVGAYLMSTGHLTVGTFFFAFQIGSGSQPVLERVRRASRARGSTSAARRTASPRCWRSARAPSPTAA